jgi:hypothetical protein
MADDTSAVGLSQEELKRLFYYHENSGDFVRQCSVSSNTAAGDQAGCLNHDGYLVIRIGGILHYAQRLAWLYVNGEWLPEGVDHKDRVRHHNWLDNLKPATQSQNISNQARGRKNTSTGCKNIVWDARRRKFRVHVRLDYKQYHVGRFDTLEAALEAREKALATYHGEFASAA